MMLNRTNRGMGQTYPNTSTQLPYSSVLLNGWSDASGNPVSAWQGYYYATLDYGSLSAIPMLAGNTVISTTNNPGGLFANSVTFVISDAQVQDILHQNSPAAPAANYIPNITQPASASTTPAAKAAQAAVTQAVNAEAAVTPSSAAQSTPAVQSAVTMGSNPLWNYSGQSNSIASTFETDYGPLPLWGWLAAGVAVFLVMKRK
jgi:hypothetical protein